MGMLFLVVSLTLLISAFCSLLEAMLYSTRVSTLEAATKIDAKRSAALRFLDLKRDLSAPTSAVLILNTIANTAGASLAGMFAAKLMGAEWVAVFSIALTFAILFLSEILPKTYGATHWKGLWETLVWPLTFLIRMLYPLIRITRGFARMFAPEGEPHTVTEEEIVAMARLGVEGGDVTRDELRMLSAVFQFDKMFTRQVMVPRGDVVYLDVNEDWADLLAVARRTQHTRYPLCDGTLDKVVGIVHIKDLIGVPPGQSRGLRAMARRVQFVPETKRINQLLRDMQRSRQHMAVVVDEHGTVAGIVTLENVIEEIVGRVQDEFDREAPDVIREQAGSYIVFGNVPLERLNRRFELKLSEPGVNTVSGLVSARLGRFPVAGDAVELDELRVEVLAAEGNRATQLRITPRGKPPEREM